MRTVVLGAGLLGVTAAYYLAKDGHEVTVVDRRPEPARETSFANAGLVTPGHASSWASPKAPLILLKSLWRNDTSLRYRLRLDPRMWLWSLQFLRNCTLARNRHATRVKMKLCVYSQGETLRVGREEGLEWDRTAKGAIYLYSDPSAYKAGKENMRFLMDQGVEMNFLDPDQLVALEPGLRHARDKLAGGMHTPGDESGDARKFTLGLAERCKALGVTFRFGETIARIDVQGRRVTGIHTDKGSLAADQYVMALGSYAPLLSRKIGFDLPIFPVKGYSVTLPVADSDDAPTIGGVHEEHLVAFSRLGDRLRLTATADFAGYDTEFEPGNFAHMLRVARDLFPKAALYDRPDYWACLRPMTPDGPPIMGPSPISNLWLNAGHGHMGWTMACGSSRLLVDQMMGRKPEIDPEPFLFSRY
ncbi:D-amino acid dehydrogenase [Dongia sp.]|uniref:D-amino acid dehydrogenase n=1 Tax=Dongia sp. TaxID=1977262 RepID=UPI0035B2364C